MNREFIRRLSKAYSNSGLDLSVAVDVWAKEGMSSDLVKNQIFHDVGVDISPKSAEYLIKVGCGSPSHSEIVNHTRPFGKPKIKSPEVTERDSEMVKFNSKTRGDVVKVGESLYRSKTAKKYWALQEKIGENGEKSLYLVAIEDDERKK